MLKKTITYTDYKGAERTEDFYFNLTKSEAVKLEMSTEGGLTEKVNRIVAAKDGGEIMKLFEEVLFRSYGQISPDGREFIKDEAELRKFVQTEAYDQLFMSLVTDPTAAAAFIEGVLPQVKTN